MTSKVVYVIRKNGASGSNHKKITQLTSCYHDVIELDLEQAIKTELSTALMLIMDVAPDNYDTVLELRKILKTDNIKDVPIFFILSSMKRGELMQANALGAAEFLSHPVDPSEFQKKLKEIANNAIEQSWENLNPTQSAALKLSLKVFEDTFENLQNGNPLPAKEVRDSCDLIIKATAEAGIGDMLSAIRTHHNYTYRHSMMVSGYLVAFALLLGVKGQDLQNVAVGGILHDIGKALVPTEILNKPSALNSEEWLEMRKHPEHSRTILENSDCHKDVIDGSIHHHEKLDGTGYPDGLKGKEISDIARMVAIAMFSQA